MREKYLKQIKKINIEIDNILDKDDIDFEMLDIKEAQIDNLNNRILKLNKNKEDNKETFIEEDLNNDKIVTELLTNDNIKLWDDEKVIKYVEDQNYYYVAESKGGVIYRYNEDESEWQVMNIKPVQELFKATKIDVITYDSRKKEGEQEVIKKENIITEYIRRKVPYNGSTCKFNKYYGNALNIASKPKIKAIKGDVKPYLDLIDIMFNIEKNEVKDSYLDFIAHMFQKPYERPLVSWTLRGAMGSYKNYNIDLVGQILQGAVYETSNIDSLLTGQFNSHLEGKLLIIADEVLWGGDKKLEGSMKDFVTKKHIWIERKGFEKYKRDFVSRLIMTSNSDFTNSATLDERRSNVITINENLSKKYRKNNPNSEEAIIGERFEKWIKENKDHLSNIYYYFLNREIDYKNLVEIVRTKELKIQQKKHLGTIYEWLEDAIENDNFYNMNNSAYGYRKEEDSIKISLTNFKSSYNDFIKDNNIKYNLLNGLELVRKFEKMMEKFDIKTKTFALNNNSFKGYYLNGGFSNFKDMLESIFE